MWCSHILVHILNFKLMLSCSKVWIISEIFRAKCWMIFQFGWNNCRIQNIYLVFHFCYLVVGFCIILTWWEHRALGKIWLYLNESILIFLVGGVFNKTQISGRVSKKFKVWGHGVHRVEEIEVGSVPISCHKL